MGTPNSQSLTHTMTSRILVLAVMLTLLAAGPAWGAEDINSWLDEDQASPEAFREVTESAKAASSDPTGRSCAPDSNHETPFVPRRKLPFCSEYSELSCCDARDAKAIAATVSELVAPECPACRAMVTAMKCSECDPDAARFWREEFSSVRLCPGFCRSLFALCSDIPFMNYKDEYGESMAFYINPDGLSVDEFCEGHVAAPPDCFSGPLPLGYDESCKCVDQNCHIQ